MALQRGGHARRLQRELDRLLGLEPVQADGRHLRDSMIVDGHDKLLVFLTRRDVEPTNNGSEWAAPVGDLPQGDQRLSIGLGRKGLRRYLLHCRNRPPRRPERPLSHPRSSRRARGRSCLISGR